MLEIPATAVNASFSLTLPQQVIMLQRHETYSYWFLCGIDLHYLVPRSVEDPRPEAGTEKHSLALLRRENPACSTDRLRRHGSGRNHDCRPSATSTTGGH